MARLPTAESLGIREPTPSTNVASYQGGVAEAGAAAMGAGIGDFGNAVKNVADQFQTLKNEAWARDAATENMLAMNKAGEEFRKLEGLQAEAAYDGHADKLAAMHAQAVASAPNPAAQKMLADQSSFVMSRTLANSQSYAASQFKIGQERSYQAQMDAATTLAVSNQNDPVMVAAGEASQRKYALDRAAAHGMSATDAEDVAFKAVGKFYRTVLGDMAARDPSAAAALFAKVKDKMDGASQAALSQMIEPKADVAEGRAFSAEIWRNGPSVAKPTDTMAIPLDDATANRADLVRSGMMKRGWSEAAAIGLAANAVQESGATTSPKPGDGGTSHGLFQWNKERIVAFRAMNGGKLPSETSLDTQLDFADKELRGTERRAGDALAGAETPEDAARIASTQFLRPKDTANEETRRAGIATTIAGRGGRVAYTAPGGDTAPDFSAMLKRVVDSDKSPAVKAAALSDLKERHSTWVGTTATERATITRQFDDIKAALMAGKDDTAVPEAEIRRLFPKPQADDMIGEAIVARGAGQAFKGVQWGTPEEIDATRADLASGTGYTATLIRLRRKRASGGGTEQGMDAVGDADTPDQIKMRLQMVGIFNKLVNEREAALKADPRGYVSQAPTVQAAIAAAQGAYAAADNNPDERGGANAARQMVLDATLTAQAMLGVPEWERRILSNAEVARDVGVITRMKPEEGDIGVQINQLVEGYGAHGNKMFGELVHNGNLPKEYMVLAHVTAPDQVVVRNELQRGLATIATMGGMEKYRALLKPEDAKTIDDDLGKRLAEFRATTYWNDDGGKELYANIKSAAQIVAYGYAYRGISATTASKDAVNGILSQYEFSGSKRVPKGQLDEVTKVTEHIQETLTPADLAPSGGNELLKPEDRTAAVALALRRGSWVPTKEGDGLTLMIPLKDSRGVLSMRVAERIGGQPITIRFNNLPWVPARPTLQGDPMGINPQW